MDLRAGQSLYWVPDDGPIERVLAVGAVEGETEWCATLNDGDVVYLDYAKPRDFLVGVRVEIPE